MNPFLIPLLISVWLAIPGVLVFSVWAVDDEPYENWILGSIVGLATATYFLTLLSYVSLTLFTPFWTVLTILSLGYWWRSGRPRLWARPDHISFVLTVYLFILCAIRFWLIAQNELPAGWDPAFHCLLGQKMFVANGMIFDWTPFEDIALNYPVGSFAILAWVKQMTGLDCHITHKVLQALQGVMTAALVYALGSRTGRSRELGLWAAGAYGFWALGGNLHYMIYGGYPNQMAMLFLVAALLFYLDGDCSRYRRFLICGLLAAAFLTHHHVMLTAVLACGVLGLFSLMKRDYVSVKDLSLSLIGAFVLAGFYMVPYALKIINVGGTDVANYPEEMYGPLAVMELMGWVFLPISLAGGLRLYRSGMNSRETGLFAFCLVLFGLFVGLDWVVRLARWWMTGVAYGLFTPWRFLTDAAPILAYFAGYGVRELRKSYPALSIPMMAVVVCSLTLTNWGTYRELADRNYPTNVIAAGRFIGEATPPDTLVLTPINWVPYLSWRRTGLSPIPTSEPSNLGTPKRQLVESILAGSIPDPETGPMVVDIRYGENWPGTKVLWRDPDDPSPQRMVVLQILNAGALLPDRGWEPGQR